MSDDLKTEVLITAREDGVEAAVTNVKRTLKSMGDAAQQAGAQASNGLGKIGSEGDNAARKIEASTRNMIANVQRQIAATEAGGTANRQYLESIAKMRGLDGNVLRPWLDQLDAAKIKAEATAKAQMDLDRQIGKMGQTAGQTRMALQQLPMQFQDIVVSLQAGQAPMTVMLQQGSQLAGSFGGVAAAAKAMGGYVLGLVNPFTLAAAAIATIGVAYYQGSQEGDAFLKAVVLSGNASGVTTDQLRQMAREMSAISGTQSGASAALAAMAQHSQVGADKLKEYSAAAMQWEKATGQAVSKTAEQFAELGREPLKASLKLNEGTNYLTESVYKQIRALEQQGKTTEAATVAQNAYADALTGRSKQIQDNFGYIERAVNAVTSAAKSMWDAMLGVGRPSTLGDQLAAAQKQLADRQSETSAHTKDAAWEAGNDKLKKRIDHLKGLIAEEEKGAKAVAAGGEQVSARAKWDEAGIKFLSKSAQMERELTIARNEAAAAGVSGVELEKRLLDIRNKFKEPGGSKSNGVSQVASIRARIEAEEELIKRLELHGTNAQKVSEADQLVAKLQYEVNKATDARTKKLKEAELAEAKQLQAVQNKRIEMERDQKVQAEAEATYRKYIDTLGKTADSIEDQALKQDAANASFGKSKVAIAELAMEQAKLAALNAKDAGPWTQEQVDKLKAIAAAHEHYVQSLKEAQYLEASRKYDDEIKYAKEELAIQQYGMTLLGLEETQRQKLLAVRKAELKLEKEIDAIKKQSYDNDPLVNENKRNELIAKARIKAETELQTQIGQIQDQFITQQAQKFDDIFRQGFADMVNNGSDGLKAFGKSLKTTVLTSIADGIYQALIKKWVVNIATNLTGGIGGLVGAASSLLGGSSGSGGGASNLLSLASNANTAYGLYTGNGTGSILGQIGNYFGFGGAAAGSSLYSVGAGALTSTATTGASIYSLGTGATGLGLSTGGTVGLAAPTTGYFAGTAPVASGGASSLGLGAFSGAGIGAAIVMAAAYLGGMFKSEKQVGAGLTGELGGDVYGYQLMREGGSLFSGPSYKYIIAEQELAKARAEIEELKKDPNLETDGNLTYRMKYLRERVEMLEGKYGSSVDSSQGPIDTLQKTYSAIRETVASQAESLGLDGEAVRQMKTVLGLDEIHPDTGGTGLELFGLSEEEAAAKVQEAMEKANEDLARSVLGSMQEVTREITRTYAEIIPVHDEDGNVYENRIWHDVTETVTSMEWVMSEYVREGETAVAALNRISGSLVGVNQVFEMLGADLLAASIASGDWASKLIEAMGGIDNLNTVAVGYYDRYYSDDEKRARQVAAANKGMEGLGLDLRVEDANAIEDFRVLVDSAIAAQDEELLASLLNISGQFGEAVDAVAAAAKAHLNELEEAARAAAEALKNALSKAMRDLEGAIGRDVDGLAAQKSALAEQRSLHNESLSLITGIFDLVASNAKDLYGTVDSVAQMQAQQGRAFISDALFAAQRTGYLPEKDALSEAINAARAGIDDGAYSTQFERDADVLKLAGQLSALEEISGKQKTFEELQLDALDNQISAIDKQTKVLQDQLAAAKEALSIAQGEYDATIGTNEALAKFYALLDSYLNPVAAEGTGTSSGGRPTVGAGSSSGDLVKAGATGKGGYYREVETGYGTTFVVDNSQHLKDVDKWLDQYRGTGDVEGMLRAASGSGDISIGDITSVMGWTKKDLEDIADKYGIPKFDVGTNYVPRDMLAQVHKGERIIPAADNRALHAALQNSGGAGDAALVAAIDRLEARLERVESHAAATAGNTATLKGYTDQRDNVSEGGNADRVYLINADELATEIAKAVKEAA